MIFTPRRAWVALAACVLPMTACNSKAQLAAPEKGAAYTAPAVKEGEPAPDFELKDADGKIVKLSDYKGKVVLLNFWATWCPPCKVEIPWFVDFERAYRDKGFAVLGVSFDEDGWEAVKPYLAASKINYRIVVGDEKVDKAYGGSEGVASLPMSYMIGRDGKIASVHVGLVPKKDYEDDIQKLLQ
jgi:cytochrome c biogenesis protein CcmG/thiol:disulfide interchange protein DsbE